MSTRDTTTSVLVQLDAATLERLRDAARAEGCTLGELIRVALAAYLDNAKRGE